ncbi:MAG: F0F1 ATP synthase subunit delta [Chromatiales bacterium]|nr:F0F1 ATP synthase subunit delta [Chromatiales bacterium]
MAGEASTIARPYAEAVFARAKETSSLDSWSDTLAFLASLVADPMMGEAIGNPKFDQQTLTDLVLDVSGDQLDAEGQNLVKLLVANDRLSVAGEIASMFEVLKAEDQRVLNVHVRSAYAVKPEQEKQIAAALKAKLGYDITITSEKDTALIGGVHIRAGDMVIDGSVSGQLQQLANELGI